MQLRVGQSQLKTSESFYTLLLRIRDLEKQVEQERWRDATKEKPDSGVMVLCLGDGICFVGTWSEHLKKWQEGPSVRQVWKWKPIYILQ